MAGEQERAPDPPDAPRNEGAPEGAKLDATLDLISRRLLRFKMQVAALAEYVVARKRKGPKI
ncbi:MAG: hypothetical protein ACREIP_05550 [Alphaproteobacteria bacterium]